MITEIPFCFRDRNEDYLTVPSLQKFCDENKLKTSEDKFRLIDNILDFAKLNIENEIKTLEWFDKCLKEGIKDVIVTKVQGLSDIKNIDKNEWAKLINKEFNITQTKNILNAVHRSNLKLCSYNCEEEEGKVKKVTFIFTQLLKEKKNSSNIGQYPSIIYPVFIDLYLDKGYMVGIAKSKSSIFTYDDTIDERVNDDLQLVRTNCEKVIREAFKKVFSALNIESESAEAQKDRFKRAIHKIVDDCTKTPTEIEQKLESEEDSRDNFIKKFFNNNSIDYLEGDNYLNAQEDLKIFMEKYLSITCKDKKIFTEERYGYPTQLAATDTDFSSIEETSINDMPLQCTPIFFDNKKLIKKQKKCDNMIFIFKREPRKYFTNNKFEVIFEVKRGLLHIKFRKYTLQEDVQNVLSRIM